MATKDGQLSDLEACTLWTASYCALTLVSEMEETSGFQIHILRCSWRVQDFQETTNFRKHTFKKALYFGIAARIIHYPTYWRPGDYDGPSPRDR